MVRAVSFILGIFSIAIGSFSLTNLDRGLMAETAEGTIPVDSKSADPISDDNELREMQGGTNDASQEMQDERKKILSVLKNDVEPNLIKGDIEKLQRNVKSLGSYRRDWSEKARETLIANPALSELYLYKFVPLRNRRLNAQILSTLLEFQSFRYPRAALAFAIDLGKTPQEKVKVLKLFEKVVLQDAHLGPEILQFVLSSWGQDIPLDERLRFGAAVCGRLNLIQARAQFESWLQSSNSFWEVVMASELRSCLKGN